MSARRLLRAIRGRGSRPGRGGGLRERNRQEWRLQSRGGRGDSWPWMGRARSSSLAKICRWGARSDAGRGEKANFWAREINSRSGMVHLPIRDRPGRVSHGGMPPFNHRPHHKRPITPTPTPPSTVANQEWPVPGASAEPWSDRVCSTGSYRGVFSRGS